MKRRYRLEVMRLSPPTPIGWRQHRRCWTLRGAERLGRFFRRVAWSDHREIWEFRVLN